MPLRQFHYQCRLVVVSTAIMLAALTPQAHANINDWQCLTSDLKGSPTQRLAFIQAASEAANIFRISPAILVAIKRKESGLGLDPMVVNHNTNGTIDRGFFQVNTEVWMPELQRIGTSLRSSDLHGIRENALVAAWILRRQMNRPDVSGTLDAVAHYHKGGGTSQKANQIRQVYIAGFMKHLRILVRRCGAAHLTTAQR